MEHSTTLVLPPPQAVTSATKAATLLAYAAAGKIKLSRYTIVCCHQELTVDWQREKQIEARRVAEFKAAMQRWQEAQSGSNSSTQSQVLVYNS